MTDMHKHVLFSFYASKGGGRADRGHYKDDTCVSSALCSYELVSVNEEDWQRGRPADQHVWQVLHTAILTPEAAAKVHSPGRVPTAASATDATKACVNVALLNSLTNS